MKLSLFILSILSLLLFHSPFLRFLAPSNRIFLVDYSDPYAPIFLAQGSEILWKQWQSWVDIILSIFVFSIILSVVFNVIWLFTDEQISETNKKLEQKMQELDELKIKYKQEVDKEFQQFYENRETQLVRREEKLFTLRDQVRREQRNNLALKEELRHQTNRERKKTQSKLAQRDRLRTQKKEIVYFLEEANWTLSDGQKLTYNLLSKLAKKHK